MTAHKRARAMLVVALVFAVATVATGFPLATLLRQRSEIAGAAAELALVRAHNAELSAQVASLNKRQTIVDLARQQYGLVRPGQEAVVILPGAGDKSSSSLSDPLLPATDLAPTSAVSLGRSGSTSTDPIGGVWARTLHALEFWRWAF